MTSITLKIYRFGGIICVPTCINYGHFLRRCYPLLTFDTPSGRLEPFLHSFTISHHSSLGRGLPTPNLFRRPVLSLFHRSTDHGRCTNRRSTPRHQQLHSSQRSTCRRIRTDIETLGSPYKFPVLGLHYNRHLDTSYCGTSHIDSQSLQS
jgi:hypothetical protein